MLNEEETNEVLNRLKNHPEILKSIKDLLDITEGINDIQRADDAEFALIPEVRGLGKKCLQDWSKKQTATQEDLAKKSYLRQDSKKKLTWHTTFGIVVTQEKCFIKDGKLLRPFSVSSGIRCRGYSIPLERAITDFGADVPFGNVVDKMKEHYGIEVPSATNPR